jgi:SiaC family regulatory phosphoprotein
MNEYHLSKTFNTPEVIFIPSEGVLKIEGRSIPEDPGDFFEEILALLIEYYKTGPKETTRVDIKLEYINSGSSKYMLDIFRILKKNYDDGHDCIINWYFEEDDESIQELGQHYQSTIQVPFKLIDYY